MWMHQSKLLKEEAIKGWLDTGYIPFTENEFGIIVIDIEGQILDYNQHASNILGTVGNEILFHSISEYVPELSKVKLIDSNDVSDQLSALARFGHIFELKSIQDHHFSAHLNFYFRTVHGFRVIYLIIDPIVELEDV